MIAVIDASVFNKLFLNEPDRHDAVAMISYCIETGIDLAAPDLMRYELLSAAIRFSIPFEYVMEILTIHRSAGLSLVQPSISALMRAEQIASNGHEKAGYPALYDSIYHALALEFSGTLITADRRHYAKTKQFGGIALLEDWRDALGFTQR